MSDTSGAANSTNGPSLSTLAQYTKDFSFENPNAPRSLSNQGQVPNISVQVNVNGRQIGDAEFEVELVLEGKVGEQPNLLFGFELTYCGIFRIQSVPQEHIHQVLMIRCPELLFPFARQIIADGVRNGGFPPLYLDPIDFVQLYQQRAAELSQKGTMGTA